MPLPVKYILKLTLFHLIRLDCLLGTSKYIANGNVNPFLLSNSGGCKTSKGRQNKIYHCQWRQQPY